MMVVRGIIIAVLFSAVVGVLLPWLILVSTAGLTVEIGSWRLSGLPLLTIALALGVGAHLFVVYYEEPSLVRRFGPEYREYLKRSPRWFAWPRKPKERAS